MSREKIAQYLEDTNLTYTKLSFMCGVSKETIRNYLKGKKIAPRVAWKIYKYFKGKIDIEEFDVNSPLTPYIRRRLKNLAFQANTIPIK